MNKNLLKIVVLVAVCALTLGGEAFAGKGGGGGAKSVQTKTATKLQTQSQLKTQSKLQTQSRQQLKIDSGDTLTTSQGTGKGSMRKLGPADGTGLEPRPLDGTGYGSPAKQTVE